MSSRTRRSPSRKSASAKSTSGSRGYEAIAPVVVNSVDTTGKHWIDVGQRKVLRGRSGLFGYLRTLYYRYTLMTGVYMLDSVEQNFLHFFMLLGAVFLVKYTYAFLQAMSAQGYI